MFIHRRRIGVAMLHQESNSFNPRLTKLDHLDVTEGNEVIRRWQGTGMPLGGALEIFQSKRHEVVGLIAASGTSGGPLAAEAVDVFTRSLLKRVRDEWFDAIYLDLHGAMVSTKSFDVSGELLSALKRAVSPKTVIAISLDSHANLTEDMVVNADIIVGFKTYPHQDYASTGASTASLLSLMLEGKVRPTVSVIQIPMIQPPESSDTFSGPLAPLVRKLEDARKKGEILDGTVFYAQPWLDSPLLASSIAVTTDNDPQTAFHIAREIAEAWWHKRHEFIPELHEPSTAVRLAVEHNASTVILSESGDAINSGAVGDNPTLIRTLVENLPEPHKALTFTCDPALYRTLQMVADTTEMSVTFGLATDLRFAQPFTCKIKIERRVPGKFKLSGSCFNGLEQDMQGAVVLQANHVTILLANRPVMCSEPSLYRCAGIEPADFKIVGIKSPSSFRPNFKAITTTSFTLDMQGASSPNLTALPWRDVKRPLFPLDDLTQFAPVVLSRQQRS